MMLVVKSKADASPPAGSLDADTALAGRRAEAPLPADLSLLVISGPDRGQSLKLGPGLHTVGKSSDCALVLSDPQVSRHHLEINVTDNQILLRDVGSRNGSYFGGARFDTLVVGAGAQVVLGETELKVTTGDSSFHLPPSDKDHFGDLYGNSAAMRRVFTLLERVSATDGAVLLQGETGTGKDLAAEAIHKASSRGGGPFAVCDLAGVPKSLLESELFGHLRGAFTGADREREGAFVQAHGGTLFLDEVGELDMETQPRLLRVLERRQVKPVGSGTYRTVNVRVIAATNRDLLAEVRAGRFRRDLYHRLAVVRIELPPLRERRDDIALLARHVLRLAAETTGQPAPEIPQETLTALAAHDWPGNVRELRNVLEHAALLSAGTGAIDSRLLGLEPGRPERDGAHAADGSLQFRTARERLVEAWERDYLEQALEKAGRNVSLAARRAGISRVYLHELLKKHGIER